MNLKSGALLVLFLLQLCIWNTLYAADQVEQDTLREKLNQLNLMRGPKPVSAKNKLLRLISNFPKSGTQDQLASAYTILGSCYERLSIADSSFYALEQARELITDDTEFRYKFDYNRSLGSYYRLVQTYDSAEIYFKKALRLAEKSEKSFYLASAYNGLGNIALDRVQLNLAFEYFLKAVQYFEDINDTERLAVVYNNMGLTNEQLGDYERGIQYFYKAIAINKANDAIYDLSMNYGNLGILYKEAGKLQEAIAVYDTAKMIAEKHGFVMDIARHKLNMGNLLVIIKDYQSAEKNFIESLKLCEENDMAYGKMLNYNALSNLYLAQDKFDKAEFYTKKANEIAEVYDEIEVLRETNSNLSLISEKRGQYKAALNYRKAYEAFNDSIILRKHKELLFELQTKYDTEKKELENVSLKAENQVKEYAIRDQKIINITISIALLIVTLLLFLVFRVSSKLKKANENLNQLNKKIAQQNSVLEETIKTKDKLFSIIGHDLRSPFNSMLGYLQIMIDQKDDVEPEERVLILNNIYSKSNDTYTLVENLLQWAMSQRGQIAYKPDHQHLFEILDGELRFLQSRADKKQIQLINGLPEQIQAWCDRDMISTIFRNIINNAIKFTPIKGLVKITAEVKSDFVFVTISDNGVGMDAETISRIQQSNDFYSLRGTENESGTGLGLKIVKDFLAANNASYSIKSVPGEGTDFVIRLNKK